MTSPLSNAPAGAVAPAPSRTSLEPLPRTLGAVGPSDRGPTLICVAGLHGNEPAGVSGLRRVLDELRDPEQELEGRFVGLVGNRRALEDGVRYLAEDLNRLWTADEVARARSGGTELPAEWRELAELDAVIEAIRGERRGPVYLLDLHTTSGPGPCFAVVEDSLVNRDFALALPVPIVLGLEEEVEGTLTHAMGDRGMVTAGFEAGSHRDPRSPERAAAAIWVALGASGVLPESDPRVVAARSRLRAEAKRLPAVLEVRHRHAVVPGDGFQMAPGFVNFQPIIAGQRLGEDHAGPLHAPEAGLLLMPLYQRQGNDGYFLVRPVHKVWLTISKLARWTRAEKALPLLPGVDPHPEVPGAFLVDRKVARWLALELFHLLGFHRVGPADRWLTMVRRHDGLGPRGR